MAKDLENTMVGNNVYFLVDINPETTNGLIVQLTQWVSALPILETRTSYKTYKPFELIPENIPVLNVYINSCGGNVAHTQSILTMFDDAHARGAIIKTYNLFRANSSASIIAVSGTYGYRYMAQNAHNFIHFGDISATPIHTNEIEFATKNFQRHDELSRAVYLANTKLTKKEITKYYNTEGSGKLLAPECLAKGLCDWVITPNGWVNNVKDLQQKTR